MTTYKQPPHIIWNCGACGLPVQPEDAYPGNLAYHASYKICVRLLRAEVERLHAAINELCAANVGETHEETLRRTIRELYAELQAYKDDPTKALREIGYHDVEQFYKYDSQNV